MPLLRADRSLLNRGLERVTKPTDRGLGSEPAEVSVTGFGMTVEESHLICKDYIDPTRRGPRPSTRRTTRPHGGATPVRPTVPRPPSRGFLGSYSWDAGVDFGGCGACQIVIWGP
jgi:hypothetical protein